MAHEIENIFSSSKTPKQDPCPNPNNPIIVDTREKQSLIAANLLEQKAKVQFEKLEIGDYLIGQTIIERKTFSDLVSSLINKRLIEQLINLKKYEKKFLILEGFDYNYEKFKIHKNAIKGILISIANDFSIPIIYTKDQIDTSEFLILTAKRYEKQKANYQTRQTKTLKTLEEKKQFILEGFPGIGPTTAKALLKEFSSLNKIFNAAETSLEKIPKMDKNKIQKFKQILD